MQKFDFGSINGSKYLRPLFVLLLFCSPIYLTAQKAALDIPWKDFKKEKINPGLFWYQWQTHNLFSSNQSINILKVKLNKRSLDLIYQGNTLLETSEQAEQVNAMAAINGGFFNTKQGGSVTYIKKDGAVLAQNQGDLKSRGSVVIRGALVVGQDGKVTIQTPLNPENYTSNAAVDDVLLSGPLLVEDGLLIPLDSSKFNLDRHPRTCACTTNKKQVLLLTIDGRNKEAVGMSLPELSQLLKALGCQDAINLDGGGSTTMYIAGQAQQGIVNFPSDNKKFDHDGQRKVSNVLVVH